MSNIMNYMIDVLLDKLDNYEGQTMYGADMGYELLEEENANGTYTFDENEALEWIKEYFDDCREVMTSVEFNMGAENVVNAFQEPEKFMVVCMLEVSSRLLGNCALVDEYWNDELELNTENIETIKKQLEAQRDNKYVA